MSIINCGCKKNGGGGNGAATLAPTGSPPVSPVYSTQGSDNCSGINGAMVGNAPYLISPDDYASLQPIVSAPVISRIGRQQPNNVYVFRSHPAGVTQVQSPKVGRY